MMTGEIQSICSTCEYANNCYWKTAKGTIWDCSEFSVSKPKNKPKAEIESTTVHPLQKSGLCASCSLVAECQWFDEKNIKFYCEHYE